MVPPDMLHTRNNIYIPMYRDIRYCIANADNISTKALVRMAKAEESQEPQEATLSIVGYEDLDYVDELYDTSDNVFSKGPEASIGGNSPNARPVGASHDANSETTPNTRRPRRRSENIGSDFVKTLEQTLNFRMSSSGSVPGTGSVDHAQKAASSCRSPPRSSSLKYMFSEPEPVTSVRETSKQRSASPRSKGARRGWLPQPLPGHGVIPIPSSASLKSVPKSEPTYDELRPTYSSSPPVEDIVRSDHQNPPRIPSVLCNPSPDRKAPPPPIPDRQQSDDSKLRPRLKVKPNLPPSMAGNITPARPESMSRSRQMTSSSSSSSSSSTSLSTSLSTSTPPIPATTSLPEPLWAWIPEDISSLTVGAVGDCLHLLHLEPHVEQFESAQVDGALLQVLTHEELQQEFGLSSVEARKLYMFAQRGWRPKLDD